MIQRRRWPSGAGLTRVAGTFHKPMQDLGRDPGPSFWPRVGPSGWAEGQGLDVLVLGPAGELPQLVPEEHAENGVRAQAQVGRAKALVERRGALLLADLHQAVGEAPVQLALGQTVWASPRGVGGPRWHGQGCVSSVTEEACALSWADSNE